MVAVRRRFNVLIDVVRRGELARVNGRVIDTGDDQQFSIMGSVQPATPKQLQDLPEGQRTDAGISIWTCADLLTGDAPDTRPDLVIPCGNVFNGITFEIKSVQYWPGHRNYVAIKVGQ